MQSLGIFCLFFIQNAGFCDFVLATKFCNFICFFFIPNELVGLSTSIVNVLNSTVIFSKRRSKHKTHLRVFLACFIFSFLLLLSCESFSLISSTFAFTMSRFSAAIFSLSVHSMLHAKPNTYTRVHSASLYIIRLHSESRSDHLLQLTRLVGGANLDHKYRFQ